MTSVAVVAHAAQEARRGAHRAAPRARRGRCRRSRLVRGAEEQVRAHVRAQGDRRAAPTCCSCGAATAWCSAASTPSATVRSCSPSCPPAPATSSHATSTIPIDLEQAVEVGLHGGSSHHRRRPGQRRALRGDGGHRARRADDPRRRPIAQGPLRSRRLRVDRRQAPQDAAVPRRGSRWTARQWFDGKAGCILVGQRRQGLRRGRGLRRRRPRGRAPRARGDHGQGRHPVDARAGAHRGRERRPLEVRADDEGQEDQDQARSQDALRARRRRREASRPAQDQGGTGGGHDLRAGGGADERGTVRPRDLGAQRRRGARDAPSHRAEEARAGRVRAVPRVRRVQPRALARVRDLAPARAGRHPAGRAGGVAGRHRRERHHRPRHQGSRTGSGGEVAHRGGLPRVHDGCLGPEARAGRHRHHDRSSPGRRSWGRWNGR